jgi:hypothetical protein
MASERESQSTKDQLSQGHLYTTNPTRTGLALNQGLQLYWGKIYRIIKSTARDALTVPLLLLHTTFNVPPIRDQMYRMTARFF